MNYVTTIIIDHPPVPFARMRTNGGRHFIPQKQRDYMEFVRLVASAQFRGKTPIQGAVSVDIFFGMPRPNYHYTSKGSVKPKYHLTPATSKPDIDNLYKLLIDALNSIVFGDDSQIVEVRMLKGYTVGGETVIKIGKYNSEENIQKHPTV